MSNLSLEFTPTGEDFKKSIRQFMIKMNENVWWLTGIFYLPISLLNVMMNFNNGFEYNSATPFFLFLLIGIPVFIYSRIYSNSGRAAKQQGENKTLISKMFWNLGEDELAIKNQYLDVKMAWNFFQSVMESDAYYFLIHKDNKNLFQLLPKRAFNNSSDENEFRNIVESKIGKIKPIKAGAQYQMSMTLFMIIAFLNIIFLFYSNFQSF